MNLCPSMEENGHVGIVTPAMTLEGKGRDERLVWVLSRHKNEEDRATITKYKCRSCGAEFGGGPASIRHHIAGTPAKGVPPCTCPDPDEKARIVRELDDKKAVREENKRKRDQAQGLDSASAGSSVNFSQPTGFPPLAAHGVGIGEGAFPGGARVGEPGAFGVNGDGGTSGRGPAPGGKMVGGGGGAGAKAHGLQSERQASFDDPSRKVSSGKGRSGARAKVAGGKVPGASANGAHAPLSQRVTPKENEQQRRRGPTLTLHKPSSVVDFVSQMQRVVQHIDDGHVTAEDCRLLGLDSKTLSSLAGNARHHCEHVLESTEWLTQVLDGEESVTQIQGALQRMQGSKGAQDHDAQAQVWSLLDPVCTNATGTTVSELLRSLAAVLKTSAAATDGEASDGEGQNADGAFVEGHVQGRNASSEARRSDRADVGADELMAACSSLDSETDSAVAKAIKELKERKSAKGAREGDVNQVTDDGQLREHCKSLHARLSDSMRAKVELQPRVVSARQYQNMQRASAYGDVAGFGHSPMGYGTVVSDGGTPGGTPEYGGRGSEASLKKKTKTARKKTCSSTGAYAANNLGPGSGTVHVSQGFIQMPSGLGGMAGFCFEN